MRAKKALFLLLLFLLAGAKLLWAQSLGFGLKAGLDTATQDLPSMPDLTYQSVMGFSGGVFSDLFLTDFLGLQAEVNFIQKGSQNTTSNALVVSDGVTGITSVSIYNAYDYLEIPLMAKGRLALGPDLGLYALAGPAVAFLLNETSTQTLWPTETLSYERASFNGTASYPSTEWSIEAGVGMEVSNALLLEIRDDMGLTNASQAGVNSPNVQNNVFTFETGLRVF